MEQRSVDELIHIAAAGGGFRIDAGPFETDDLTRIAAAAAGTGARVTVCGADRLPTGELVRIATAGRGAVSFE